MLTVHCDKCGHVWTLKYTLPMDLHQFTKAMENSVKAGCPECGSMGDNIVVGNPKAK